MRASRNTCLAVARKIEQKEVSRVARQDDEKQDRDVSPLLLPATAECPECGVLTDVVFRAPDGIFELEDLVDAPEMPVLGYCGHKWNEKYGGWIAHEDAG